MNTIIRNFVVIAFAGALFLSLSCKSKAEKNNETPDQLETTENLGKEYTSEYVCPMHCEGSGSDKEGTCPECGMAYVLNEEHKKDGHTH